MISWTRNTVLMQFIVFCFADLCNQQLIYCQCFSAYVLLCLWFVDDRMHSVCLWTCRNSWMESSNWTPLKIYRSKAIVANLANLSIARHSYFNRVVYLVENNFLNDFHWNTSVWWLETWLFKCVFCAVWMLFAQTRSPLQASGLRKHAKTTLRFLSLFLIVTNIL